MILRILCTDASSNASIFFFLSLKWAYFLHTTLIHFFITSLLFQAFFYQNINNCLFSTRGCFSSSFAILPFGFPLNTNQVAILNHLLKFTKLQLLENFLAYIFNVYRFWTYFCNCLSSCYIQKQGCLIHYCYLIKL